MVGFNRSDEEGIWFQMHILCGQICFLSNGVEHCADQLWLFLFVLFLFFLLSFGIVEFAETFRLGPQVSVQAKLPVILAVTSAFGLMPLG